MAIFFLFFTKIDFVTRTFFQYKTKPYFIRMRQAASAVDSRGVSMGVFGSVTPSNNWKFRFFQSSIYENLGDICKIFLTIFDTLQFFRPRDTPG